MRVDLFFVGYVCFRVAAKDGTALFALLSEQEISPKALKRVEKSGEISFVLPLHSAKKFEAAAEKSKLQILSRTPKGAPVLLRRLAARPGLLIGVFCALLLFCGARLILWDVRIQGATTLKNEEIERELEAAGLARGCFLPTLDRDAVCAALRQGDERIGYVTVNLVGTVAHVQIRETQVPDTVKESKPANLVARCDGVIALPLVYEGECLVAPGEVVRTGQLLVSGVRDTQNHGYRVTRAAGEILAQTVHTYRISVPFAYEEKVYTGEIAREISLIFFNRAQKVFKNTGKTIGQCDIIEKTEWITLPSGKRLPFGISTTTATAYTQEAAVRTAAAARARAMQELEDTLAADSVGRTLLQKHTELCVDAEAITVICTVICEENIAVTSEIEFTP